MAGGSWPEAPSSFAFCWEDRDLLMSQWALYPGQVTYWAQIQPSIWSCPNHCPKVDIHLCSSVLADPWGFHFCLSITFPLHLPRISSKEQTPFNFMAAVSIYKDLEVQENKIRHCFYFFPFCLSWSDGIGFHELVSFNVEIQVTFFTLLFHHHLEFL